MTEKMKVIKEIIEEYKWEDLKIWAEIKSNQNQDEVEIENLIDLARVYGMFILKLQRLVDGTIPLNPYKGKSRSYKYK